MPLGAKIEINDHMEARNAPDGLVVVYKSDPMLSEEPGYPTVNLDFIAQVHLVEGELFLIEDHDSIDVRQGSVLAGIHAEAEVKWRRLLDASIW